MHFNSKASESQGLVMVFTGPGKGKTTAALGAALRATGSGLRVLMIQFIKGGRTYGELAAAKTVDGLEIRPMGLGLIRGDGGLAPHLNAARRAWRTAGSELASGRWEMLILDEVFPALEYGFLERAELEELIKARPADVHLILTGRGCPPELHEKADMVTEMAAAKHHLEAGINAQAGIEF
jgi:cob(I)alamin adenosyltransferase